jgi:dTDP-4-dehydrorhamnose 3,5-epimerase
LNFTSTPLAGAYLVDLEPQKDDRGFFARTWCQKEFEEHGLNPRLVQSSVSFNIKKGTWRGMHYQASPHQEAKLVRCTAGAIHDVIVDLRPHSPTFRQHFTALLSATNRKMLYVPEEFAHGFVTLEDNTEVFYQMSEFYHPELARGVRWNDPAIQIVWPAAVEVISERDRTYADLGALQCA